MPYSGSGRKIVLKLKHGDRLDMVMPLARWMSTIGKHLIAQSDLLIPVPLHRIRLFQRRYNQSAELSRAIAQITGKKTLMDALIRTEYSELKKHKNREERIQNIQNAFTTHKPRSSLITGKNILLIDDVMTTGATLSACTRACNASGARTVRILVLCRTISNKTACIP
jgi:ComF family protein